MQINTPCLKTHLLFSHADQRNSLCLGLKSQENSAHILQFWNFSSTSSSDPLFDFETLGPNGDNTGIKGNNDYSPDNGIWSQIKSITCHTGLLGIEIFLFRFITN